MNASFKGKTDGRTSCLRRLSWTIVAGTALLGGALLHADVDGPFPAPNLLEAESIEEGKRLGLGSVSLSGPTSVEVMSFQTWTIEYTAGKAGIAPGGSICIAMRHLQNIAAGIPQTRAPSQAGYVTAEAQGDAEISVSVPTGKQAPTSRWFPWQHIIRIDVGKVGLSVGEKMYVTIGDRARGGPGMRVQPFDETDYAFKVFVDAAGDSKHLPLSTIPTVRVHAAAPSRLSLVMPSDAVVGRPTWLLVRAEDRYGNPALSYRGRVALSGIGLPEKTIASHTFTSSDRGVFRYEKVVFDSPGVHRLAASDRTLKTTGNPVIVHRAPPERLLLWGDLHGHTLLSDGRGTVEEFYDFAQRVAGLDFCAVTDHAFQVRDEMWNHSKQVTRQFHRPGRFVTFQAYEWSGPTLKGGDHNIYFLDDDVPIYRSELMYSPLNIQMDHASPKQPHITDVFSEVRKQLDTRQAFCIPHFGGRKGNPSWHDPSIQRLIEVFSEHRRSEDWAATFLQKGYRIGHIASTDGHYGNPGYGYLKPNLDDFDSQEIGMAAVAVYAPSHTRAGIFESLYNRHCYATSGDRIILSVDANEHPMGSEIQAGTAPLLKVRVEGTAPIHSIVIKKNGHAVHTWPGDGTDRATLEWRDPDFSRNTCFYYVQVVQKNDEEAISSPIWVN